MIRVGFTFSFIGDEWLGGLNYFRSLFSAVLSLPGRKIEPIILLDSSGSSIALNDFPPVTKVESSIFGAQSKWAYLQWVSYRCFKRDLVVDAMLRWHGISLLSHSYRLGFGATVPTIAWIPDFQHVHLPDLFRPEEIEARNKFNARLAATADRILVSSRCAQEDFSRIYPRWVHKSRVLPFVAQVTEDAALPDWPDVANRHDITGPYFLVANQFWAHKNHKQILDALRILKERGAAVQVLATGKTFDHRWPEFFSNLMQYGAEEGVLDCFRVLGVVPRHDLAVLMKHSVALLNPSRFEGWNTGIEEAKVLGVRVIASDIPVHREQAAPGAIYVDPNTPRELATAMHSLWTERDRLPPVTKVQSTVERRQAFARAYQEIVLEVVDAANTAHRTVAGRVKQNDTWTSTTS